MTEYTVILYDEDGKPFDNETISATDDRAACRQALDGPVIDSGCSAWRMFAREVKPIDSDYS